MLSSYSTPKSKGKTLEKEAFSWQLHFYTTPWNPYYCQAKELVVNQCITVIHFLCTCAVTVMNIKRPSVTLDEHWSCDDRLTRCSLGCWAGPSPLPESRSPEGSTGSPSSGTEPVRTGHTHSCGSRSSAQPELSALNYSSPLPTHTSTCFIQVSDLQISGVCVCVVTWRPGKDLQGLKETQFDWQLVLHQGQWHDEGLGQTTALHRQPSVVHMRGIDTWDTHTHMINTAPKPERLHTWRAQSRHPPSKQCVCVLWL